MRVDQNPFGEELMILNGSEPEVLDLNPVRRRRRKGRKRKSGKRRSSSRRRKPVTITVRANPRKRRRRRSRGRKRTRTIRIRRNPVRSDRFRWSDVPRLAFQGLQGTAMGGLGYYGSKLILPARFDRNWVGYATHGALGTGAAWGITAAARAMGFKKLRAGPAIVGVWATVGFRVALNHFFSRIARPKPLIKDPAAEEKGLEGVEEFLPIGYDVDPADMGEDVTSEGQEYTKPTPYDVGGQEYTEPTPYDVGQEYEGATPYDVGDETAGPGQPGAENAEHFDDMPALSGNPSSRKPVSFQPVW